MQKPAVPSLVLCSLGKGCSVGANGQPPPKQHCQTTSKGDFQLLAWKNAYDWFSHLKFRKLVWNRDHFPLNNVEQCWSRVTSITDKNALFMPYCNPFTGLWCSCPSGSARNPHGVPECYILHSDLRFCWQMCTITHSSQTAPSWLCIGGRARGQIISAEVSINFSSK